MNAHTLAQPGITLEVSELTDLQSTAQSLRWRKNQLQAALQPGSNITHHLGHGMQFRELRPYQKGDDIRHINWKATARTGKPFSNLYTEDHERPICLWLDLNPTMYFGTRQHFKSTLAIKLAATIAWSSHFKQEPIACYIDQPQHTWFHPAQYNIAALLHLMAQLAQASHAPLPLTATHTHSSSPTVNAQLINLPKKSTLIVISDANVGVGLWQKRLDELNNRLNLQFIHISDPIEYEFKKAQTYPILHKGKILNIDMQKKKTRAQYKKQFINRQLELQKHCESLGIDWLKLSTSDNWQQAIQSWTL